MRCGLGFGACGRAGRLIMGMASDTQQGLLQIAVAGQDAGIQHPVDPAIDHDGHLFGDLAGDPDVLLDHQDVDIALLAQANQHLLDLGDDDRGQTLGRLVHHQQAWIGQQGSANGQHLLLAPGEL